MSGLEIVGFILASSETAVNALAAIKRRLDAQDDIARLIRRCGRKLRFIDSFTQQLDTRTCSSPLLDTMLRNRLDELEDVEHKLSDLERKTTCASLIARAWKSQDYAKALQHIADDLDKLQAAFEVAGLYCEPRHVNEKMACVDATAQQQRNSKRATKLNRHEGRLLPCVELSARDIKLLARYGNLDEEPLADSLYWASFMLEGKSAEWAQRKSLQFLRLSADLLHELANYMLGLRYNFGDGVKQDDKLAISHYLASGPRGNEWVARLYFNAGEHKMARKHLRFAMARNGQISAGCLMSLVAWCLFGPDEIGSAEKYASFIRDQPLVESMCRFWGIGTSAPRESALRAYEKCNFEQLSQEVVTIIDYDDAINEQDTRSALFTTDLGFSLELIAHLSDFNPLRAYYEFLIGNGHVREIQSLGATYLRTKDWQTAKRCFQRGARLGFIECQVWLCAYYQRRKRTDRAEHYLHLAVKAANVSNYISDERFRMCAEYARATYFELYDSKRAVSRAVKDTSVDESPKKRKKKKRKNQRKEK